VRSGKLEGRAALVTGAGRGIGQAVALKLASEGARVVVNDLDTEPAADTVSRIRHAGGEAVAVVGDVTAEDFAERFVETALDAFGDLHIIINNAGFVWDNVIQKMTDEQWRAILDLHLTAPFRILRAAAPYIRSTAQAEIAEGREVYRKVVNISSIAGVFGNAGQANYAAAKAGLVGLTGALAKEWGRFRVNVNCVAFGLIDTRLTRSLGAEDAHVQIGERQIRMGVQPELLALAERLVPLGRAGTAEEAAGSVYMFCIPESNYVTGETLICSGGFHS